MPDVKKAMETFRKYKEGRKNLENRIRSNEQWYKLMHWQENGGSKNPGDPEPTSAWLLNSMANKHADAMDNYPDPVILPRAADDQKAAKELSEILPVILEQQRFEETYDTEWWRKLKTGTAVYGVFWDKNAENGLGDVAVRPVDLLSIYWEPGVGELEESRNVFVESLVDRDILIEQYPQLEGKLGSAADVATYIRDENVDTSEKASVIDWYYKVRQGSRTVLHYAKFCGDELLYASEDDASMRDGFYAHGRYPFVIDTQFKVEDSPCGFGWLDVCKSPQMYIDKLGQVILKNSTMAARPRFFVREDGSINEAEYADTERDFVHFSGSSAPTDSIFQVDVKPVDGMVLTVMQSKIDELKETSGNRDFSQGGTSGGVTAASSIAALQEAGSKLIRDMLRSSYRAFSEICTLIIELIRQFYTEERTFRIVGEQGEEFVTFSNASLAPQPVPGAFGLPQSERRPVFDIQVKAQKRNAFSTLSQNELAKEFYSAGFFNPQLSDQALACIDMMDFEGKDEVRKKIMDNGTLYQQVQQLTEIVNRLTGGALMQQGQGAPQPQPGETQQEGGSVLSGNSREAMAMKARERSRNTTAVD